MTPVTGAWGQTRTRHAGAMAPSKGGVTALGDTKRYRTSSATDPTPVASSSSQGPQVKYGGQKGVPKIPSLEQPTFTDARWQRNVADLAAGVETKRAETLRSLQTMRQNTRAGKLDLGEKRSASYEGMYGQLGAANAGRSGAVGGAGGAVQRDYQRNLDSLLREFGPQQQKLTKQLYEIAQKQYAAQLAAETGLAVGREQQYQLAGQAPPTFEPTLPPAYLQSNTKAPKKKDQ